MHKHFADWYRAAHIEPMFTSVYKSDDFPKRWAGVEAFTKEIDAPMAMDCVRVFFGLSPVAATFLDTLRVTFQKADPAFRMRDNDVELRVLTGATIVNFVSSKATILASAVALATTSTAWQGLRKDVLIPDVWEAASQFLFDNAGRLRVLPHLEITTIAPKNEELLTEIKASLTADAFAHPFQKLNNATGSLAKSTNEALAKTSNALRTLREESDILWWVFARTSRDTKKRFSLMKVPEACLLMGKELADVTAIIPGPIAVPAVLDRLLADSFSEPLDTITLDSAVEAVDSEWRAKVVAEAHQHASGLAILHTALRASMQDSGWKKSFQSSEGFNLKKQRFSPLQIALQMYNERLLHRALNAVK
jgi:hypothetical protein